MRNSYRTACGGTLVVPRRAREHLLAHPEVGELIEEAAGRLELPTDGSFLAVEVDFDRVLGRSGCVEAPRVRPDEPATFALRVARDKPSRVMVGVRGPETTKMVVLAFAAREAGTYVLITSWVGGLAPKEPWDRSLAPGSKEAEKSLDFWSGHALVHDPEVMGEPFEATWASIISG